jgi:wyosine [tRNA(Phe)-imidazoG37] synthetase (radical SAM superfamily)
MLKNSLHNRMIAYGPVPSRRLGRSLGVNHIPPKTCTYSCVYCQLGRTDNMLCDRKEFYGAESVIKDVGEKVKATSDKIDYVTFVPDGEPTLDIDLGDEIRAVKRLGLKTAVICNSSLLWMEDVRDDLAEADWVSLKVDAVTPDVWRRIDRPHGTLDPETVLDGMREFSAVYKGYLATETMLIKSLNDGDEVGLVADFIQKLTPDRSYIALPTRPPADDWVKPADEEAVNRAYQVFSERLQDVEYLIGYEGNAFSSTGNLVEDLLSITAVHPMREEAVTSLIERTGSGWEAVKKLIDEGRLVELEYLDKKFYMRKISSRAK